ncbi:Cytidylate kinase [Croceitalea dokdonensis DOKDO 023]|uniref:Cytidylate kinase n=1 Tax=Croceitalea dokdonensis DOKDO 023 TaxID=1300341 RepID=A0A0P7ARL5_9FLAO|nr:(d)CMP kinase [Croceitalea dokdonensis]KPM30429.1 Cytidylate kinase [Croceitalea dokdonensis DOKDO 023]
MHKITIAIDGFSSTGKSTIAKQLAAALGYIYVDTGAMYRAVTLYALHHGLISEDGFKASELCLKLKDIQLGFLPNEQTGRSDMLLNGKNVETEIRTMQVSRFVSQVATVKAVREKLVAIQQEMGKAKGIVMDGRDIGTVVFPHAELKLFMTASADARATRRYRELLERGDNITYGEVLENVQKRDYIDSNREESPLRRADDAILFDNSDMGLKEQFERIYNLAIRIIEKL